MDVVTVKRGQGVPHEDLLEVIIPVSEFRRWYIGNSDVSLFERKNNIQRSAGGFNFGVLFPLLAGKDNSEDYQRLLKSWKRYILNGDPFPADLYVETDEERIEREAIERENAKTPETKRLERQIELSEKESSLRSAVKQINAAKVEIDSLRLQIEKLEASVPTLETNVSNPKAAFDKADAIVQELEAKRNFQPVFESKEQPIVVHPDDYSDISHGKRSLKSKK